NAWTWARLFRLSGLLTTPGRQSRRTSSRRVASSRTAGKTSENRPSRAKSALFCLATSLEILITRLSVDPGRELNGRSQQYHFGDFDVTGPVGPSSRASAF